MVTCKECNKRFKIKLNSGRFGIKLKGGYQTTCPFCGYVTYLGDISQVRSFLFWSHGVPIFALLLIRMNTRWLDLQELVIVEIVGAMVLVYVIHRLSLWIAGKIYDKLSK